MLRTKFFVAVVSPRLSRGVALLPSEALYYNQPQIQNPRPAWCWFSYTEPGFVCFFFLFFSCFEAGGSFFPTLVIFLFSVVPKNVFSPFCLQMWVFLRLRLLFCSVLEYMFNPALPTFICHYFISLTMEPPDDCLCFLCPPLRTPSPCTLSLPVLASSLLVCLAPCLPLHQWTHFLLATKAELTGGPHRCGGWAWA